MSESSDAAEQVVRMMLSGGEVAIRLSGSALKNGAALLLALSKNHKKVYGKINLRRMLNETRDIRAFPMQPEEYRQFAAHAKRLKILFSAIQDKDNPQAMVDVLIPTTEIERVNMIFERMQYVPSGSERQTQENTPKEEHQPKKESRSGRASQDTRDSSSTWKGKDRGRTMHERPSVEQKLKENKAALEKKRSEQVPARTRTKAKAKGRAK